MEYNTGNYDKYMTKNPLKRKMVERLNTKILASVCETIEKIRSGKDENPRILDAGCGEGFITNLIAANIQNADIIGLEYADEALEIARKMNPQLTYVQGNIYNMPFKDNAYEVVICTEVLEHLEHPESALKELMRVCGKYLIITVPNEPWFCLGNLIALKNVSRLGNPIDHINHWTYRGFQKFVEQNTDVHCTYDKSFPWSIAALKTF